MQRIFFFFELWASYPLSKLVIPPRFSLLIMVWNVQNIGNNTGCLVINQRFLFTKCLTIRVVSFLRNFVYSTKMKSDFVYTQLKSCIEIKGYTLPPTSVEKQTIFGNIKRLLLRRASPLGNQKQSAQIVIPPYFFAIPNIFKNHSFSKHQRLPLQI